MTNSVYADDIDETATYQTTALQDGDSNDLVGGGTLAILKGDDFFVHAACIETKIPAPLSGYKKSATYKDEDKVTKSINSGYTSLDDEKIRKIKKIIYLYSEKNSLLNDYATTDKDKYQATWAAIAKITCDELPPHASSDGTTIKDNWSGKAAYEYLLKVANSDPSVGKIEVPSGLKLAFFENISTDSFNAGTHLSQTMVALKLYGPDGPGIKNTTVTAEVGAVSSTATDSAAATASLDGTNSASLSDKIELNNLDSTKSYKVVTGIYKVSGSTGTLVPGSEKTIDVATSDIDTDGTATKTVAFNKTLTDEGTYTIVTKLYEGSVSDANLKATHNGNYSVKKETVEVESSAPSIGTTVSAAGKSASETAECSITAQDAETLTEVKDEIAYKKLIPDAKKYDITAELYEVKNGAITGGVVATATAQETSDSSGNGTWTVTIPLNGKKLEPGKSYVVYETVVYSSKNDEPASSPYDKKMEHKDPKDKAQIIVVGNYPPVGIKISKNVLGGSEVAGAKMKLSGGPNDITESWTSTASAKEFSVLPGEYTLVEEVAPAGLKKVTTTMKFTVKSDGTVDLKTTSVNNGGKLSVKEVDGVKNNVVLEDAPIEPDLVKTVNGGKSTNVLSEGDVVGFEISAKVPYGVKEYTILDKLPKPLIYVDNSISVTVDGDDVLSAGAYAETSSDEVKVTLLSENGPSTLKAENYYGKEVIVSFKCKLDSTADLSSYGKIINIANVYIDGAVYPADTDNEAAVLGISDLGDDEEDESEAKGAKTGDDADIFGLLALVLASAAAMTAIAYRRRRN